MIDVGYDNLLSNSLFNHVIEVIINMFRLFSNKSQTSEQDPYTLASHRNHLKALISDMEDTEIKATNTRDEENATNQLNFAWDMFHRINEMLALSSLNFTAKKELGEKMTLLPQQYFGRDEIPLIEGEKSKDFALKIAKHYRSFTKVQFNTLEVKASTLTSKIESLHIRSIPDQIEHHRELAERIEKSVEVYNAAQTRPRLL
jgi:hypothetical protein